MKTQAYVHIKRNAPLFKYSQDTLHTNLVLNDKKFCKQFSRDLLAQVSNESLIRICFSKKKKSITNVESLFPIFM